MPVNTIDMIWNVALLLFWMRVWPMSDRAVFFNPILGTIHRVTDPVLKFLQPAFGRLSSRYPALLVFVLLLVGKALAFAWMRDWGMRFGFEQRICAASAECRLVFTVVSFAMFLFKIWGFSLLYVRNVWHASTDPASEILYAMARPFDDAPVRLRPFLLVGFGLLIGYAINACGLPSPGSPPPIEANLGMGMARLFVSTVTAWVGLLPLIASLLILLIILSWAAMFSTSGSLAFFSHQWIDLLLGPLRRYPIHLGPLDLMPLLVLVAIQLVSPVLLNILSLSYAGLLP